MSTSAQPLELTDEGRPPFPPSPPPRRLHLELRRGWPMRAAFYGFPIWWLLGLGSLVFPLLAVPMAVTLWRRRATLRVPRGFGLWLLFLIWMAVSVVALDDEVPDMQSGEAFGRVMAFAFRAVLYLSATVLLLYVGNLGEDELSSADVTKMMAFMFVVATAGGVIALVLPTLSFTSPVELLLPRSLLANGYVYDIVHPGFAQVQDVIGSANPRPKAPFEYSNEWGANLSYLLPFFVVVAVLGVRGRRRAVGIAVLLLALLPVVFSLNRGLWLVLILAAVVVLARSVRLDPKAAAAGVLALGLFIAALAATPLGTIVTERVATPHSDSRRVFLAEKAVAGSLESPLLGWGGPRTPLGSPQSIAVGGSTSCPQCGAPAVGTHGQLWLVLFSQGIVGAVLFVAFFVGQLRRSWSDRSTLGQAVSLVILLWLAELVFYNGLPASLHLVMVAVALGWRAAVARAARAES